MRRRGSISMALILVLTLMVGTFVLTTGRIESSQRLMERNHQTIAQLQSAIDAVDVSKIDTDEIIRLPLDGPNETWVYVQRVYQGTTSDWRATLIRRDVPGFSIQRPSRRK